jgi:hypothetical protein
MTSDDKRLRKVSEICLALPEANMERSGSHATFRVRKKVFAYFLDNQHGDGIVSVCARTHLGENQDLATHDPNHFYLPAYIGVRGWVGLRLDRRRFRASSFVKASVVRCYDDHSARGHRGL